MRLRVKRKDDTTKSISDRAQKRQAALDKRIQQKKERKLSKKSGKPKPKDSKKPKSKTKGKKQGRPGFEGSGPPSRH